MNKALLMLGTNLNAVENMMKVQEKLSRFFSIDKKSTILLSKPVGIQYNSEFLNLALEISTNKTKIQTVSIFKQIETEMGRIPESKINGQIPIDIDLIGWNHIIEHQDYYKFDFVRICIDELLNDDSKDL